MRKLKGYFLVVHPVPILGVCAVALLLGFSIANTTKEYQSLLFVTAAILFSQITVGTSNDLVDFSRDQKAQPWKPLVAGMLSQRDAYIFIAVAAILLALSLFLLTPLAIVGVLIGTVAGLTHNFLTKGTKYDWLSYLAGFIILPITVWFALQRWNVQQGLIFFPAIFLMLAVFLARDVPDIASDANDDKHGLAVRLGTKKSIRIICICLILAGPVALAVFSFVAQNWIVLFAGLLIYFCITLVNVYRYLTDSSSETMRVNFRLTVVSAVILIGSCLFALKA
jgi:4-hydroxybenzoate polyprenyltransferase